MYVTRPLSLYRKFPSALSADPPEGPYTGCLVITDEESETQDTSCFGACKKRRVKRLPFPQDKILNVIHWSEYQENILARKKVWFLPVLDQPLSSNCYYVIKAKGRHKGQALTCSRDDDMGLFCCCKNVIKDVKPKPLDPRNIYQQFKINRYYGRSFFAKSLAPYGYPPELLRNKGWEVRISSSSSDNKFQLRDDDALGLDVSLRTQLPSFNFPISSRSSSSVIVGTWYCPFMFIREEARIREQMKKTRLYKMTLEQHWEEIYSCDNVNNETDDVIMVNTDVKREVDLVFGREAEKGERSRHGAFIWYKAVGNRNIGKCRGLRVGLSYAIVEKMKWVLEAGGWVDGPERTVGVEGRIEIGSESECEWRRFSCYVLVESFVLRRMDGNLVLQCDFRHTNKVRCKYE